MPPPPFHRRRERRTPRDEAVDDPIEPGEQTAPRHEDHRQRRHLYEVLVHDEVAALARNRIEIADEGRRGEVEHQDEPDTGEAGQPCEQPQDQEEPHQREPPHRDQVGIGEHVGLRGQPPELFGQRSPGLLEVAGGRPRGRRQLGQPLVEEVPPDEDPQRRDRDHRPAGEHHAVHVPAPPARLKRVVLNSQLPTSKNPAPRRARLEGLGVGRWALGLDILSKLQIKS